MDGAGVTGPGEDWRTARRVRPSPPTASAGARRSARARCVRRASGHRLRRTQLAVQSRKPPVGRRRSGGRNVRRPAPARRRRKTRTRFGQRGSARPTAVIRSRFRDPALSANGTRNKPGRCGSQSRGPARPTFSFSRCRRTSMPRSIALPCENGERGESKKRRSAPPSRYRPPGAGHRSPQSSRAAFPVRGEVDRDAGNR